VPLERLERYSRQMSETKAIFRNTAAQSMPIVSTSIFGLLLAPVMLSRLGLPVFGVWAATGALAQYAKLLDLGITNSVARFVALYDAEGDRRRIEETVGIGVLAASAAGLLALLAAAVAAPLVHDVLGVISVGEMRVVLLSAAGISAALLIAAVISAVPVGLREMTPPNVAATAGNVVNFVFSLIALALSTSLEVYALANLAAAIVSLLLAIFALLWVWGKPYMRRPSVRHSRTIVSFGVKSQLVTLADLVNLQTDKLIIAAILGPATAGAFELANRVVQGAFQIGVLTLSALIPTATADLVKRGKTVIVEYLERYTVRSLAIALPLFGAVCVSAPYLLQAWLNQVPPESVQIVILSSFALGVNMTTGVAMTLVVSDGAPGLVAQTAALLVVVNVAVTIAAAPIFGLWGVLLATFGAQVLASTIFLVRWHRRYSLGPAIFLQSVAKPATVVLGLAVPFGLWYLLGGGSIPDGRPLALIGTLCTGGVYFLACWVVESHWRMLPDRLSFGSVRRRFVRARSSTA
jgi:O-antigen/teichoic acid export membrane protein